MKKLFLLSLLVTCLFLSNNCLYAAKSDDFDENDFDYYDDYIAEYVPPHLQDELYYFEKQVSDAEKNSVIAYENLLLFIKLNNNNGELDHLAVKFYGKKLLEAQQHTRDKIRLINYPDTFIDIHYAAVKYGEQKLRFVKKLLGTLDGTANKVDMSKERELLEKATKEYREELSKISNKPGQIFKPSRDIEIIDCYVATDLYGNNNIEGTLKNNTLKTYNTVQLTFNAYDENGRLLGVSEIFTQPIGNNGTYYFSAPITAYNYHYLKLMKFRATEITSNGNIVTSLI